MANRVIRDWTASETVDELSIKAEVFFTRLIMKADDHGCFHANPKLLKAAIFPLKDVSTGMISIYLRELIQTEIVKTYKVEGREYLQIINFGQRLRTMSSKFPLPDSDPRTIDSKEPPETKRNEVEVETRNEDEIEGKNLISVFDLESNPSGLFIAIKDGTKIMLKIHQQSFDKYLHGTFGMAYEAQKINIRSQPPIKEFFEKRNGDIFSDNNHVWNSFKKLWLTGEMPKSKFINKPKI